VKSSERLLQDVQRFLEASCSRTFISPGLMQQSQIVQGCADIGMRASEFPPLHPKCCCVSGQGASGTARRLIHCGKMIQHDGNVGMVRTVLPAVDAQRLAIKLFCFRKLSLAVQKRRQGRPVRGNRQTARSGNQAPEAE